MSFFVKFHTTDGEMTFAMARFWEPSRWARIPFGLPSPELIFWIANQSGGGNGTVTKLRANDGTVLGTYPMSAAPLAVAFDGTNVWVTFTLANIVSKL